MSFAKEISGEWYGVAIPSWLRAFDCRSEDVFADPRSPWGTVLYSDEKAQVDLGLRTETYRYATTPLSCSTYIDARRADDAELARQVRDMAQAATKLHKEWEKAASLLAARGEGGSCVYCPVAICMSNFGWSVLSDERTCRVRRFAA